MRLHFTIMPLTSSWQIAKRRVGRALCFATRALCTIAKGKTYSEDSHDAEPILAHYQVDKTFQMYLPAVALNWVPYSYILPYRWFILRENIFANGWHLCILRIKFSQIAIISAAPPKRKWAWHAHAIFANNILANWNRSTKILKIFSRKINPLYATSFCLLFLSFDSFFL